jgi:acetoin utilization protein AcuB
MGARAWPVLRDYMTPAPVTVNAQRSLAAAANLMREHGVRHLPVLDGGRVAGLVSERDLLMVEAIPSVNPTVVRVEEAMVENVFCAAPGDSVAETVAAMIERKLSSAVIVEGERVAGVFTTIDALRALHDLLAAR